MIEEPPYDLPPILTAANVQHLLFVGREMTDTLLGLKNPENMLNVDVIMFPFIQDTSGPVAAGNPRKGVYRGRLLSCVMNEIHTKGHFVFEDGTTIYRDKTVLE